MWVLNSKLHSTKNHLLRNDGYPFKFIYITMSLCIRFQPPPPCTHKVTPLLWMSALVTTWVSYLPNMQKILCSEPRVVHSRQRQVVINALSNSHIHTAWIHREDLIIQLSGLKWSSGFHQTWWQNIQLVILYSLNRRICTCRFLSTCRPQLWFRTHKEMLTTTTRRKQSPTSRNQRLLSCAGIKGLRPHQWQKPHDNSRKVCPHPLVHRLFF